MRMCAGTDGIREDDHTCGAQVNVIGIQGGTIKGGEPVDQRTRRIELQNGLGEIGRSVVGAVASCDINVAARIGSRPCATIPDGGAIAADCGVRGWEYELLGKRCRVVAEEPALPVANVAMRSKANVNRAVGQQQCGPVEMAQGAKVWSRDDNWSAKLFCAGRDIEGMQAMNVAGRAVGAP